MRCCTGRFELILGHVEHGTFHDFGVGDDIFSLFRVIGYSSGRKEDQAVYAVLRAHRPP